MTFVYKELYLWLFALILGVINVPIVEAFVLILCFAMSVKMTDIKRNWFTENFHIIFLALVLNYFITDILAMVAAGICLVFAVELRYYIERKEETQC